MAALRWDEKAQAFVESTNVPMRYDAQSQAWVETTGMAWDEESQAWTEKWNTGGAYVYGAAFETVTIKKGGIIVATVDTDSTGKSTDKITLSSGTYTLTGSVSGWTEGQTVDENTTKLRAMPEKVIYWYGYENEEYKFEHYMNYDSSITGKEYKEANEYVLPFGTSVVTSRRIPLSGCTKVRCIRKKQTDIYGINIHINSSRLNNDWGCTGSDYYSRSTEDEVNGIKNVTINISTTKNMYIYILSGGTSGYNSIKALYLE